MPRNDSCPNHRTPFDHVLPTHYTTRSETVPFDARFPNQNVARACWQYWVEWHRCINKHGEGAPECAKLYKYQRSMCPEEWVERWEGQIASGINLHPFDAKSGEQ